MKTTKQKNEDDLTKKRRRPNQKMKTTQSKKTKSPKPKNVKGGVVIYELFGDGSDTGATRLVLFKKLII